MAFPPVRPARARMSPAGRAIAHGGARGVSGGTALRCIPEAPPPSRRPQRHRCPPPPTLGRPAAQARPPQEAVARTSAAPSQRCVRRLAPWRRASKTMLVPRLRHGQIPRADRDPDFGLAPLEFQCPRTTLKIQRDGCYFATVVDSNTTVGGHIAKRGLRS
eukprot:2096128-Prymnesium_polylepis.1